MCMAFCALRIVYCVCCVVLCSAVNVVYCPLCIHYCISPCVFRKDIFTYVSVFVYAYVYMGMCISTCVCESGKKPASNYSLHMVLIFSFKGQECPTKQKQEELNHLTDNTYATTPTSQDRGEKNISKRKY